jgi:tetratricopeptide (TPR) repeat protein
MSYSNQTLRQPQKSNPGCSKIIIVTLVIATIYSTVRYFIDKNNYEKAHQAYLKGDCEIENKFSEKILDSWRLFDFGNYESLALDEHIECGQFLAAAEKQAAGDPSGAIEWYSQFVFYDEFEGSPLKKEAVDRIKSIFAESNIGALTNKKNMEICGKIDAYEQENLLPQKNTLKPKLLYGCGQTYEEEKDYSSAIKMYENFLSEYPSHSLAPLVKESLARVIVTDARASGAGTIPAPERSGSTSSGTTVVVIQNDSPEHLRIVFSGPDARIEELEACSTCKTYSSFFTPSYCPEKGPVGRYTLSPGQYAVVVQSISDVGVTPWTGDWTLLSGDEYQSCFFITVTSIPVP